MTFTVKTELFEGPLGLLLQLIEDRKLAVHEVSLAEVTDAYLDHLQTLREQPINDISQFITIAGTLILIKSKALLPNLELTEEEETSIEDLETRLAMLQQIHKVMPHVAQGIKKTSSFALADYGKRDTTAVFAADKKNMNQARLIEIARGLMQELQTFSQQLPETDVAPVIKIEEIMRSLEDRIMNEKQLSFSDLAKGFSGTPKEQKVYVIVSFLAMLEMVRNGLIDVLQHPDGDIAITKN